MTDPKPPPAPPAPAAGAPEPGGGKPEANAPPPPATQTPRPLPPSDVITRDDIIAAVQAAVRKAKEGDMHGAEVVRRFWHGRRELVVLDIANPRTAEEIADAQAKVLELTFAGGITPREGRDLSTMVENRRRALHTLEQQRQLDDMVEFARQHAPGKKGRR